MKIGIITCWQSQDNYGQQLQCYALQLLLRSWGHDAYLIRYAPEGTKPSIWERVKNLILNPKIILLHLPFDSGFKRSINEEKQLISINKANNRLRQFEEFRQTNLKMTKCIYKTLDDLRDNPPKADIYITGSDQVWHDSYYERHTLGWFLQFGNDSIKRISYAASIGRILPSKELRLLRKFLSRFEAISVREETARQQCVGLGYDAKLCIDPTMLISIDNYKNMAVISNESKKYAFLYVLNVRSAVDFYWPEIKEYLDYRNISFKFVTGSGYYPARQLIEGSENVLATIPEWLGYIENSDCVFTTSFHGTVFAILMHKPFLTIGLRGKYMKSNSRMEQLLQMLNISERILDPNKSIKEQMESKIDWNIVDDRLEMMRLSSLNFLKKSIYEY